MSKLRFPLVVSTVLGLVLVTSQAFGQNAEAQVTVADTLQFSCAPGPGGPLAIAPGATASKNDIIVCTGSSNRAFNVSGKSLDPDGKLALELTAGTPHLGLAAEFYLVAPGENLLMDTTGAALWQNVGPTPAFSLNLGIQQTVGWTDRPSLTDTYTLDITFTPVAI